MNASSFSVLLKGYEWWIMLPVAAVLAYLIVRLYRRETEAYNVAGRRLRILRATVIVLLCLLMSQPVIHRVIASYQAPVVIVLRDSSTSMTVKDAHEPLDRRIRAAIALGLLDEKLRDAGAESARDAFTNAQSGAETAGASLRQAVQLLQESTINSGAARERVADCAEALKNASRDLQKGIALIKAVAGVPGEVPAAADSQNQTVERLSKEISETAFDTAETLPRLQERSKLVATLAQEIAKLAAAARQQQDRVDRALGEGSNPVVKAALEKLNAMDRTAIVAGMLDDKAAKVASGKVQIVSYGFDTDLRDLTPLDGKNEKTDKGERTDTDLAAPLVRIAERHAKDSIAAVVVCTDGRHTSGPIPEDAARVLSARGITVHTLGVGSMEAPPDICVARLEGTLSVFMEETIRLTAHIKVAGFKGQKCLLVLARGEQVVQQRELILSGDGWLHENFEFPADKSGPNLFTATVKQLPAESLLNNNSAEAVVDVASDRLKVLLVDELPRWETRYVASLLRRERKMTLDDRWLLSGENLGARPKALPQEDKALEEYEIIIMGDVPAERFSEADQKRLASYVADRGGFLVIIAGPKAMPQSYLSGPIADLLPVRQFSGSTTSAPLSSFEAGERVRVKLDPAGARHEIVRILRDPTLNEKLWPSLPELHWVARPAYAKPGATPLLLTDDARKDVVVATQSYGAGRVLYIGSDGTWNWRYKVADRVHAFFWAQAMRWGTSNRLTGGPRLKAGTDRRQVRPGENVEILARPRDANGKLVGDCAIIAELAGAERPQRVQLQPVPDSGGLYRGYLQNLQAGVHAINVAVDSPGFENISQELQVIARDIAGQEGIELARDTSRLAAMAKAGNGRNLDILDAPELFTQLAGQGRERAIESSYEVWSSYPALILVVLLLAVEWLLRKRMGLA